MPRLAQKRIPEMRKRAQAAKPLDCGSPLPLCGRSPAARGGRGRTDSQEQPRRPHPPTPPPGSGLPRKSGSGLLPLPTSWQADFNPEGIVSSSPGLRGTSYPGSWNWKGDQPQRGCLPHRSRPGRNPVGVDANLTGISQGSSFLATLGFGAESLWDSQLVATEDVGNGKSGLPHSKASRPFPR